MASKITAELLRPKFSELFAIVQAWRNADGPNVSHQGISMKWFSPPQEEALRRFLDECADEGCEVEDDAKGMLVAIDSLSKEYEKFRIDVSTSQPQALPGGSNAMWGAFDRVVSAFQVIRADKPRSVKELRDIERVGVDQIARIYGWAYEDGSADTSKVQEEYDAPGTHYDAKTWVAPGLRLKMAEDALAFANRRPRRAAFGMSAEARAEAANVGQVPSLDELVALGAPAAQLVRLHGISEEKAEELLRKSAGGQPAAGAEEKIARDESNQVNRNREGLNKGKQTQPA